MSDSIWIGVLGSEGTTITRTMPGERSAEPEIAEIPQSLRRSTGLGVEVLAKAVGVSKVTYHKWLKGAGISEDSKDRLSALLQTFAVLASIRTDLRRFLDRQTPAGTPLELLAQQKDALVIGLALRGDVDFVERPPMVSEGTLGLSPVRPIGWATAVDRERLEDFRPSGAFDEPADVPEEDEPIGVEAVFFGTHRPA
ncbi:MAG: helix-turn-helix domain-containing protein [Vulcanimicrobiaceae bacterium]